MRKTIIAHDSKESAAPSEDRWFDLEKVAQVEVTSEDPAFPIEAALLRGRTEGWRAADAGEQMIRLKFDTPQQIEQIELLFVEETVSRTQEFTLRWVEAASGVVREIVRQQYHFSAPPPSRELETYTVSLTGVSAVELTIIPEISGGGVYASLARFRLR